MSAPQPSRKKPYATPKLRRYGDLRALTQGKKRNKTDPGTGLNVKNTRTGGDT